MSQNTDPILIDRLDNDLSAEETARVDAQIRDDKAIAAEYAMLELAVETVSLGAIREKVIAFRTASGQAPVVPIKKPEGAVVRSFSGMAMRIAVIAILVLGVSIVYKYNTVNSTSVFNNSFSEYELGTTRGNEAGDRMEAAYRSRDWAGVLEAFQKQAVKTNKSFFLAGMAELELKQYPASVGHFEQVLANNAKTKENYFQPETEYYLGLAYLMNNQSAKGLEMIRKIRSDLYHPYYPLASKISATDLKIIELKK